MTGIAWLMMASYPPVIHASIMLAAQGAVIACQALTPELSLATQMEGITFALEKKGEMSPVLIEHIRALADALAWWVPMTWHAGVRGMCAAPAPAGLCQLAP